MQQQNVAMQFFFSGAVFEKCCVAVCCVFCSPKPSFRRQKPWKSITKEGLESKKPECCNARKKTARKIDVRKQKVAMPNPTAQTKCCNAAKNVAVQQKLQCNIKTVQPSPTVCSATNSAMHLFSSASFSCSKRPRCFFGRGNGHERTTKIIAKAEHAEGCGVH